MTGAPPGRRGAVRADRGNNSTKWPGYITKRKCIHQPRCTAPSGAARRGFVYVAVLMRAFTWRVNPIGGPKTRSPFTRYGHVTRLHRIAILQYQARLRLPDTLSHSQKMQCVDHIIEVLDLAGCQDTSEYDGARRKAEGSMSGRDVFRPADMRIASRRFHRL